MNDSTMPRTGGEVPKPVFATMMFAYATDLVSRMATVLGKDADAKQYGALFDDIKAAFNKAYVTDDGHIEGNTQAGYALALHFDLLPESKRAAAVAVHARRDRRVSRPHVHRLSLDVSHDAGAVARRAGPTSRTS